MARYGLLLGQVGEVEKMRGEEKGSMLLLSEKEIAIQAEEVGVVVAKVLKVLSPGG